MNRPQRGTANANPLGACRRLLRRIRATDTGQSLVEFAMVLPLFLVLLFALVDFGRAFYGWLVITNAAREGARAGAVAPHKDDWPIMQTAIYKSMCNPYPGSCSVSPSKLTLTSTGVNGARGNQISVQINYAFTYATPIGSIIKLVPGGGGGLATPVISAYAAMRLE